MFHNSSQEKTNVDVSDEYDSPPHLDSVRCRVSVSHPDNVLNGGKKNEESNTQILLGSDNEDEMTSSGVSEEEEDDDDDDDDEEDISIETNFEEGNTLLQPYNSRKNLPDLLATTPKHSNASFTPTINQALETVQTNNDQMIAQTMAVLAGKYRDTTNSNSTISSFVGPCPLYSLPSSFGLDMHHGLTHFPCRDVLVGGGGHTPAAPLWQHLTAIHSLNMSTASCIISHLLTHGYSSPSPILFHSNGTNSIQHLLRTTPRYSLVKRCPLNAFGFYGIRREHGTRTCSGLTLNSNLYSHLRSFHKMTDEAAERLARAVAFHDGQFKFEPDEIVVNERINCPILKWCQMTKDNSNEHFKYEHRLTNKQRRLLRKHLNQQEVNSMKEPVNQ